MSHDNSPETYRELLRLLVEFLAESGEETPDEVDEYLRDAGYIPDDLVMRMRQRMKKAMDASPLNWRNQTERIQQERDTLSRFRETLSGSVDQLKIEINTLLHSSQARLSVHHRNLNLDEMTEDDLAQLLAELQFQLSERRKASDKNEDK
ncbi:MAG: hypothetical protein F9K27_17570 [Anaerolineae bacterium]|nr:MAG: hypothetical protein F9K27_17570 [Anaerolineae bacterium]